MNVSPKTSGRCREVAVSGGSTVCNKIMNLSITMIIFNNSDEVMMMSFILVLKRVNQPEGSPSTIISVNRNDYNRKYN